MKIVATAATILLTTTFVAQTATADADLAAGESIAYSCLGCHGIDGYRNAYPSYRVPKLGGQKATYIEIALKGYREGTRQHPTMYGQANSLSDQQIADVSAYLATLAADTVEAGGSEAAGFEKAQACTACHGNNGVSVNAMWPTLAGQHEDYLEQALHAYRDGTRNDPVMSVQAQLVAEKDIALLAKYYAGLEGLETTKAE
ncbi:MAG: c-type cytochrome [Gammaproteobacteria bacterium]|nr:c-type cytochrome [Gammaproteobacteria bacterium]